MSVMPDLTRDSEHWRMLARRAGVIAARIPDLDGRMRMLNAQLRATAQEAEKGEGSLSKTTNQLSTK
jgi:hypothetical protein